MLKLKGVKKSELLNWICIALKDAESSGLTLSDLITELEEQKRLLKTDQQQVIESGRY